MKAPLPCGAESDERDEIRKSEACRFGTSVIIGAERHAYNSL